MKCKQTFREFTSKSMMLGKKLRSLFKNLISKLTILTKCLKSQLLNNEHWYKMRISLVVSKSLSWRSRTTQVNVITSCIGHIIYSRPVPLCWQESIIGTCALLVGHKCRKTRTVRIGRTVNNSDFPKMEIGRSCNRSECSKQK